jgi:hypothetical protein
VVVAVLPVLTKSNISGNSKVDVVLDLVSTSKAATSTLMLPLMFDLVSTRNTKW